MVSAFVGPFIVMDDREPPALSHRDCRKGLARHDGGRVPARIRKRIEIMQVGMHRSSRDLAKSASGQVITSSHINPEALSMIVKVVRTFRTGT